MMETNVILKYHRESDCWLCPECDTENGLALGNCALCGSRRSPSAEILRHWTEADDRVIAPPPRPVRPNIPLSTPVFRDAERDDYTPVDDDGNSNAVVWGIFIMIVLVVILVIVANN